MGDPTSDSAGSSTEPLILRREMSTSHVEFMRSLPAAIAPATYTQSGLTITVHGAPGNVEIRLSEERERRIALTAVDRR